MSIGSLISLPIKASGEVLGVLNVSHPHAGFFTETHERSLVIFANFLGQMLVNNRLLNSMEQMVRERTRQLEQTLADAEALKRRYAELSVIDELTGLHNRRFFFPRVPCGPGAQPALQERLLPAIARQRSLQAHQRCARPHPR